MLILAKDKVKSANVIATSQAVNYPVSNLKSDRKSATWRSTSSNASITVSFDQAIDNDFVGFALNNFDANTNVKVEYSLSGNVIYSTGNVTVGQVFDPPEGFDTNNSSSFAYCGGNYFSIQTSTHQVHDINITIDSSTNPDGFIEISRLVAGKAIQTNYGASIGVVTSLEDRSEVTRTEAGDSVVDFRPVSKSLEFNLAHLSKSERAELINIFRSVGKRHPVYISLAQGKDEDLKKSMEIYGRLDDLSLVLNELYVSECSIKIDEI